MSGPKERSLLRLLFYFLASAVVVTALFGARTLVVRSLGNNRSVVYGDILSALAILVIGYLASFIVERYVFRYSSIYPGMRRQAMLRFLTRLFIYLAVALAGLAAFGVSFSSALFGGAFVTVLLGLAGQTVLANLLAGVALVLSRPFEVGDRITFMTWQFPVLMPSYPHDLLRPMHTGVVVDLRMMHTALQTNDGSILLIPNGIMIQAAMENLTRTPERRVTFRFDVDAALDPELVEQSILRGLADAEQMVAGTCRVSFVDLAPATYSVAVTFACSGSPEEAKSEALKRVVRALRSVAREKAPA